MIEIDLLIMNHHFIFIPHTSPPYKEQLIQCNIGPHPRKDTDTSVTETRSQVRQLSEEGLAAQRVAAINPEFGVLAQALTLFRNGAVLMDEAGWQPPNGDKVQKVVADVVDRWIPWCSCELAWKAF